MRKYQVKVAHSLCHKTLRGELGELEDQGMAELLLLKDKIVVLQETALNSTLKHVSRS